MRNKPEFEINIVKTWDEFERLESYILDSSFTPEYAVIDVETDNKIEKKANLYGIGFCFDAVEAFYIPIKNKNTLKWWTEEQENRIKNLIFLVCQNHKILGHNIIYDALVLENNWDIDIVPYIYSDTILQKHIINEEGSFALKEIAVEYLGNWADKAQEQLYENIRANGGSVLKGNVEMYKADTDILGEYCCWDVLLTRLLFDIFEEKIKKENLYSLFYEEEIIPLYKEVTIPMKRVGFPVDTDYFKKLKEAIAKEIENLEDNIQCCLIENNLVQDFCINLLNKDYAIKRSGTFPKILAEEYKITLPQKNGKITLAKNDIAKANDGSLFYRWVLGEDIIPENFLRDTQHIWFYKDNPEERYIFNLKSNNHLKWLFFECLGEEPLSKTEKGEPQVDDDFLDTLKDKYEWVSKLLDYKKLMKLKSTYIEGVLERQIDGVIYSSFIQFGPPSGRYASRDPNLQNLPRVKEDDAGLSELVLKYVNSIKKGFIAPEGYVIVNADYSQLEPRAFAEACGDVLLQQVFHDNEDLYGSIAKNIWNLECSANEVKKLYPEYRQKAKVVALAVVYGAEAGRISKLMDITYQEAQEIIEGYLNAYPGLKEYMKNCNEQVCNTGRVLTKFGRVRHLPIAKTIYSKYGYKLLDNKWANKMDLGELRWKFKNMLNLAKNFPIQGVAAHTVNRAAVAINRKFKELNIKGQIVAQVHDELTCIVDEKDANIAKEMIKECMENTTKLSVPLKAEPLIAKNWAEAK